MRRAVLLLTLAGAVPLACAGVVLAQATTPERGYPTAGRSARGRSGRTATSSCSRTTSAIPRVADEQAGRHGLEVSHVYRSAIKGYAAYVPNARLSALRADGRLKFISEDRVERAYTQTLPTGVNRVEADLKPDGRDGAAYGPGSGRGRSRDR